MGGKAEHFIRGRGPDGGSHGKEVAFAKAAVEAMLLNKVGQRKIKELGIGEGAGG